MKRSIIIGLAALFLPAAIAAADMAGKVPGKPIAGRNTSVVAHTSAVARTSVPGGPAPKALLGTWKTTLTREDEDRSALPDQWPAQCRVPT